MEKVFYLSKIEQLKALSDPLRMSILNRLIDGEYTGQQLSEILNIPRSKVHYHLQALEKNGIIEVVRREEKNGILQKFYRSVARSILPSDDLLPFVDSRSIRQVGLDVLRKTQERMLKAPLSSFSFKEGSLQDQTSLFYSLEVRMDPEKFAAYLTRMETLLDEIKNGEEESGEVFNLTITGFSTGEKKTP